MWYQETCPQLLNARKQGKKTALSTIYVDYSEYDRKARSRMGRYMAQLLSDGQTEYLEILARAVFNGEVNRGTRILFMNSFTKLQLRILAMVDILLPNSES